MTKRYIGDGAYVELAHGSIILTTENGISVQNRIVLGGSGFRQLLEFVKEMTQRDDDPDEDEGGDDG